MDQTSSERERLNTISLLVIATVAAAAALIYTRTVMVPFVLAVLLSYLVQPLVDVLQLRARTPRWLAVVCALIVIFGLLLGLVNLIASSITSLEDNISLYRERTVAVAQQVAAWLNRIGMDVGQQSLGDRLKSLPLFDWIGGTVGGLVSFSSDTALVVIFMVYLLLGRKPCVDARREDDFWAVIETKIRRYLITKISTSLVTGVLVALILSVFGLDLALVFGLLALLMNFIPNVGSVIATFLPLPVALVQFDNPLTIIAVIALPGLVQMTIGNVIEPKMMGDSMDLHPIVVLLALVFWGLIWGIPGMLLATPITAVFKLVLERFETTRPVARLLAGHFRADS